ncbi:hypothetical protein FB451DRAFT_299451 [Mycena latifolia]|nr:hypothetical protein FB451DRAFT_299451 [Mycena latifolia]
MNIKTGATIVSLSNFLHHTFRRHNSMSFLPSPSKARDYMITLENRYAVPAKQFISDSFEQYPMATSVTAIFAATSFTPIVISAALAVFTICLAASTCLVTLIGLALCLAVVLSSALASSVVVTALAAEMLRLRRSGISPIDSSASDTNTARLRFPRKRGGWKRRALAALVVFLVWDVVSRIRIARIMRSRTIPDALSRAIFGYRHRPALLRRILTVPVSALKLVWLPLRLLASVARLPFRLFGGKMIIVVALILLVTSPRLRAAARRTLARAALRVSTAAGAGGLVLLQSAPAAAVRALPWTAYTSATLAGGKQITYRALAALVAFLRAQLEQLEDKAPASRSAPSSEEASYEMVSPIIPAGASGSTAVSMPGDTAETSTLRERKVVGEM